MLSWLIFLNAHMILLKNHCFLSSTPNESTLNSLAWLRVSKASTICLLSCFLASFLATSPSVPFYQSLNLKFPQYTMLLHAYMAFSWALPSSSNDLPPLHLITLKIKLKHQADTPWILMAAQCFLLCVLNALHTDTSCILKEKTCMNGRHYKQL